MLYNGFLSIDGFEDLFLHFVELFGLKAVSVHSFVLFYQLHSGMDLLESLLKDNNPLVSQVVTHMSSLVFQI